MIFKGCLELFKQNVYQKCQPAQLLFITATADLYFHILHQVKNYSQLAGPEID